MSSSSKYVSLLFNLTFKVIVCGLLIYLINNFIYKDSNFIATIKNFEFNSLSQNWIYFLVLLGLMPFNWMLESLKWQWAMNEVGQNISFSRSVRAVVLGVTLGIVTPARIGEYVGRAIAVNANKNSASYLSTFICSLAQNVVNILLGILALMIFVKNLNFEIDRNYLIGIQSLILIAGILLYFRIDKVLSFLRKKSFAKKYLKNIPVQTYSFRLQVMVLVLSLMRYSVYLLQYILVLKFFNLDTSIINYISAIGTIFLVQSSIPVPPILDLFARGEIAILILTMLKFDIARILMSTGLLWVINLILPALLGLVFLLKVNVLKSLGYEIE